MAAFSPIPLSKNQYYDRLTERVIKKVCSKNSVCIDAGANNGKILALFIKHSPNTLHYAFEPLPQLYKLLVRKYGSASQVYKVALSNKKGMSDFNAVISDPAYSGLKKRPYDNPEKDEIIQVKTDLLDNIIEPGVIITLLKLDVEGGEYDILLGAKRIITESRPYILFEFGKGGSDAYHVSSNMMYNFFSSFGYQVNLLDKFLKKAPPLALHEFDSEYHKGKEYFFIAYPA